MNIDTFVGSLIGFVSSWIFYIARMMGYYSLKLIVNLVMHAFSFLYNFGLRIYAQILMYFSKI